jgi:hypothetical protein
VFFAAPGPTPITANLCGIRYQRPCNVDSDCGPAFTCTFSSACAAGSTCGTCRVEPGTPCVTSADCPKEWDCYAPCACTNAQTICVAPFERFGCPECAPIQGP